MISLSTYKIIHILGLLLLFTSLGGMTLQAVLGNDGKGPGRRLTGIAHGVGLVLILVGGFGALARLGVGGIPNWAWVKIVLWLFFGGVIVAIRKMPHLAGLFWWILPILGAFAGYLAIEKPF